MSEKIYTAAVIVIGNEILSGRTLDKNTNWIAGKLNEAGVRLMEARVIPDLEPIIVHTVNEMRAKFDYVFTTGGIGPTHDDITAACIAKAFETPIEQNEEAYQILLDHYGKDELTEARLKMAQIPVGAELVPNPVSSAPGFKIDNVHVMAGVPKIMQSMMDHILPTLQGGAEIISVTLEAACPESVLAPALGDIQSRYETVDIGSYPQYRDGRHAVSVVLRGVEEDLVKRVAADVEAVIQELDL